MFIEYSLYAKYMYASKSTLLNFQEEQSGWNSRRSLWKFVKVCKWMSKGLVTFRNKKTWKIDEFSAKIFVSKFEVFVVRMYLELLNFPNKRKAQIFGILFSFFDPKVACWVIFSWLLIYISLKIFIEFRNFGIFLFIFENIA